MPHKNKKILIIEDDRQFCNVLMMFLKRLEYEVEMVHDGKDIISVVKTLRPDLVFLDISLSVPPNGVEVCRLIKTTEETKQTKVIMLTASEYIGDVDKSFELGAEDYVFKPFNADDLTAKLKKYLSP